MWIESMYSLFGTKWLNLHSGPMWKVEDTQQDTDDCSDHLSLDSRLNTAVRRYVICIAIIHLLHKCSALQVSFIMIL